MDLYETLLGIPLEMRPPDYYRLLGVARFEADRTVIDDAARRRSRLVKGVQLRFPQESQDVLDEIARAKVCLSDPAQREVYDRRLRASGHRAAERRTDAPRPAGADPAAANRWAKLQDRLSRPPTEDDLSGESWSIPGADAPSAAAAADAVWTVGSARECEIRVRSPWVSRRHCKLQRVDGETRVTDLESTNGTYVNDVRIDRPTAVGPDDVISLGHKTWVPWPLPLDCEGRDMRVYSVGRSEECDFVLDDKSVSHFHAQLIVEGPTVTLQDLGSLNGTRIGRVGDPIGCCELLEHLPVFFGSVKVYGKQLLELAERR